jgi:cysteinyl-tRNA synthetase
VTLRLYNTLSRREEDFTPGAGNTVRMYSCGLTVYARGHVGNFRYFVSVDVLRRTLRHLLGYDMRHVVNFTDVDDKTILGAQKAQMDLRAYTDQFIGAFRDDAAAMNLEPVEENPRATDPANIHAMANLIAALTRNGHTYEKDGSIYFRIATLPAYGKLAQLDHEGMKDGVSVDADTYAKDDARDFVLWKGTKPGEPSWPEVGPPGRPGWHLECSAMALRLLGEPPIDIHTGGIDLIFPHHENEIAQSEGATGKPFSRFWFHVEYLLVDSEKMSKSTGNVHTIPELVAEGHRPSAIRYLLLSTHYRKQMNLTDENLEQAEASLKRLTDCLVRAESAPDGPAHPAIATRVSAAQQEFAEAMCSDLNTAAALAAMFDLVRVVNAGVDAGDVTRGDWPVIRDAFAGFDQVLGILSVRKAEDARPPVPVEEIERKIAERKAAKRDRKFDVADRIRKELADRGILLEDGPDGTRWKLK